MNIVDLGLVYDVEVEDGLVRINMTLTSPGCPAGPMITNDIYKVVRDIEGVKDVDIDIVWEPYWTPERIDPKIRAMMGFSGRPSSGRRPSRRICHRGTPPIASSAGRSAGRARTTASSVVLPHNTPGSRPS